jgi:PAS domain-containing protein
MLKKDGTPFRVELSATVSLGFNNQPAGLLSVVRDITESKQAQEALQDSEERFRQLADNIREVFWMSTPIKAKSSMSVRLTRKSGANLAAAFTPRLETGLKPFIPMTAKMC